MIKLGGLIDLKPITEADVYTATSKETGTTSVFKTKDARDAAIKAGTHEKRKDDKDGGVKDPTDKPKVNIFNKDKKEPKSEPSSQEVDEKSVEAALKDSDTFINFLDNQKSKFSKEDLEDLKNQTKRYKKLEDKLAKAESEGDDKLVDELESDIRFFKFNIHNQIYDLVDKNTKSKKDKEEPKSSTPKLDKDGDGGMSSDTTRSVEDYLNKKLGLDGSADLNSGGAIEYMVGDSRNAIIIGNDEIDGKPFSVSLSNIDTGESNDTYKSFDNQEDAMAYAKELGQKLKGGKDTRLSSDEKEDLENRANDIITSDDIRTIIDDYKDKLSPEQVEVLKQAYDEMEEADHLKYDDESAGNEMFDDAFYKVQDLIQSLDENETISTRLRDLLPERIINEGTRSQVGIIDRSGKIASAYVHYDGYPSNMKPGLKKHMKNEKDVLNLIKQGGARGIYNDKDIEYYKSGKPTKGNLKDFEKYVDAADRNGMAEYVYLYNMKDKKWYFADVYGDKKLKKLF